MSVILAFVFNHLPGCRYRQANPKARIMILDNHGNFGGHAKRNDFHQGGLMRLAWGGVLNLEYSGCSDGALDLLRDFGFDAQSLAKDLDVNFYTTGSFGPFAYFDAKTYRWDVLVPSILEKICQVLPLSPKPSPLVFQDASCTLSRIFTFGPVREPSRNGTCHDDWKPVVSDRSPRDDIATGGKGGADQ